MADRSIKVRLSADVSAFQSAMSRAAETSSKLATGIKEASQTAEWQQVAGTVGKAGAAMAVLLGAVAKTGVQYNTLQQTSRAALTTLTGSAAAASAQMDKLDAFARTSPFAKDVWITAQQQMLGFGIEAGKVIPYMDAINDAVAAMGGSNHDISEIARIISQISASAKITATDLREFGTRGIDAATLIGSQMDMTGQQIRESITAGTLDAGEALDALAAGMSERFGGAAENIKNTMDGAFDRVKAAWRDLSADLTSGLVDPSGGGFLVDATNKVADFLRAIEAMPDSAKTAAGATATALTVGSLGVAGVMGAITAVNAFNTALRNIASTSAIAATAVGRVLRALGPIAIAVGLAAGAYSYFTESQRQAKQLTEELTDAIYDQQAALGEASRQSMYSHLSENTDAYDWARELGVALVDVTEAALGSDKAIGRVAAAIDATIAATDRHIDSLNTEIATLQAKDSLTAAEVQRHAELVAEVDALNLKRVDQLGIESALLDTIGAGVDATDAAVAAAQERTEATEQSVDAVEALTDAEREQAEAMGMTAEEYVRARDGVSEFATAQYDAAEAAERQADALNAARDAISAYYDGVMSTLDANIRLEASMDKATAAAEENGRTLDITTEAGRNNQSALNDIVKAAYDVASSMAEAGDSTADIATRMVTARERFVETAVQMGRNQDEAEALADSLGLIPDDVATLVTLPGVDEAQWDTDELHRLLQNLPSEVRSHIRVTADLSGYWDVNERLNRISCRTVTAYVAMKQYGQAYMATGGSVDRVMRSLNRSGGGAIYGPGTKTSDSVPIWASRGEYMQQAKAVDHYGLDVMDAMNSLRLDRDALRMAMRPGYAGGGRIDYVPMPVTSGTAGARSTTTPTATFDPRLDSVLDRMDRMTAEFSGIRSDLQSARRHSHMGGVA